MSFGALSAPAKEALGRGASEVGTSTTPGDGGMTEEERHHSKTLVYQVLPSRYGMNPDDLRRGDAIEVVVGQGAKPGGGGMLLGHKISDRVAAMRNLPKEIDQRSACRHPDWTGPDDLEIKIHELREITDWEKPVFIKVGATRTYYDVQLAVKSGADVIVVDGMQGGTAATQDVFIEHAGIPTLPAARLDPVVAGRRVANYLRVMTLEAQTLARACGKTHVHNLEPEDLVALTVEAAAMAGVPLAGTSWIPGVSGAP